MEPCSVVGIVDARRQGSRKLVGIWVLGLLLVNWDFDGDQLENKLPEELADCVCIVCGQRVVKSAEAN